MAITWIATDFVLDAIMDIPDNIKIPVTIFFIQAVMLAGLSLIFLVLLPR
ncbi:MAG: hypothetical protein V4805_03410 [Pseudomonadota bacterium]